MFCAKQELTAGVFEVERDFGQAGQVSFVGQLDVDEFSGTTFQVNWYTRETETDTWGQPINGHGAIAVNTDSLVSFDRSRYVKAQITITGTDLPAGVVAS